MPKNHAGHIGTTALERSQNDYDAGPRSLLTGRAVRYMPLLMKSWRWLLIGGFSGLLGACGDSAQPGEGEDIGAIATALTKGTQGAKVGDSDYCDSAGNLCGVGEGDCDSNAQCQSGLACVAGNLAKRGAASGDACAPATCGNGVKDSGETSIDCGDLCGNDCTIVCDKPNGDPSKCSTDCPCSVGEGDCDSNLECAPGLICGTGNGAAFGLAATTDVCWGGSTCQNGVKDGTETAVDCGGSCAPCAPPAAGPVAVSDLNGVALVPIVIAPHSDGAIHTKIVTIANELCDKLNALSGTNTFTVSAPTNTPSGISLGIDGDFPNAGWPYQGYFRPGDLIAGGAIQPERLTRLEQYVLRTPQGSNRVIVAGATTDALQHATWDLLSRVGYRHYYQTGNWELIPRVRPLSFDLKDDKKPAFYARNITFNQSYFSTAESNAANLELTNWRKHNRLGGTTALNPVNAYSAVISSWATRHAQAFPPILTTKNTSTAGDNQFCLSTVATLANGTQVRAVDAVREWAQLQTTVNVITLSPNSGVVWTSSTCPDANDPLYSNVANRVAAIANAAAEAVPTKVISGKLYNDIGDAPTIALRQNVFMVVDRLYTTYTPFSIENRLSNWNGPAVAGGVNDFLGESKGERPGVSTVSTQAMFDRVTAFYRQGARQYSVNEPGGWGLPGPSPWVLSQLLWDADAPLSVEQYRADFFSNAFGNAAPAARKYFDALEDHPLNSESLLGSMYSALQQGFATPNIDASVQARLGDLAIYTRYLELYRKFWNRCSAQGSVTEQSELKELLQFLYSTRSSAMVRTREAMAGIITDAGAPCATGSHCTSNGCALDSNNQLTGVACVPAEWNISCPSPTQTTACGTCYGTDLTCNATKTGTAPSLNQFQTSIIPAGVAYNSVLDSALLRSFTQDLVPYTPEPATLTPRMPSLYTLLPNYMYLQKPAAQAPLGVHVLKYSASTFLLGRLSGSNGQIFGTQLSPRGEAETDWTFGTSDSNVYRFDIDDQGDRVFTSFPAQTRLAIPAGKNDPPLALNYRWSGYFLVPAGTQKVVGFSESDGQVFRTHKVGASWVTDPGIYLSDYAVGHACTNPRITISTALGKTLDDNFVIPISPAAPTDELWFFNDPSAGTVGDRRLLNVPPYIYRAPNEVLVPREVAPETTTPQTCNATTPCPSGQYCTQAGTCRSEGGGCTATNQCATAQSCQSGQCACTTCSSSCTCGTGGACQATTDCRNGLTCTAGICQDCSHGGCQGDPCSPDTACVTGMTCSNQQCIPTCDVTPNTPACIAARCSNGVKDAGESDVDCGGQCAACQPGKLCGSNADCAAELTCGINNGGYFGFARSARVCWSTSGCEDGVDETECGTPTSICGKNCGGVVPCDPAASICPGGEVCKLGLHQLFGLDTGGVCVDPTCPSNDPNKCGTSSSLCGKQCICTPDCSTATAANPDDHCGGICPHLCATGQACCTSDLNCAVGEFCSAQPSGAGICRPAKCAYKHLAPTPANQQGDEPPLCGSPNSPCGAQCPACTPACGGRQCGLDPVCGTVCGSGGCGANEFCNGDGQCVSKLSTDTPPHVHDGQGNPIPLPVPSEAPTAPVGALAGQFSVSEEGTAQFSIPIEVPPGRAGMEPGVSLRYMGSKSSGEAGIGWGIEGLSQITRCPRIYALDGYASAVKNDSSDRFCLDGKRLETIAQSAAYGTNGAEYRTLIDSFTKVISRKDSGQGIQLADWENVWANVTRASRQAQGPDYFEVWTKDGRKLTYGHTPDSLLMGRDGVRTAWLLNRVEDRAHNTMTVHYRNLRVEVPAAAASRVPNMVDPASIWYTGHGDTEGNRELRFEYDNRVDALIGYGQGSVPRIVGHRLRQITTFVKGSPVRNYRLKYASDTLSQLTEVKECTKETDTTCKSPTKFEYVGQGGEESGLFTQPADLSSFNVQDAAQLDANGDGIPDFLTTTVHVGPLPGVPGWIKDVADVTSLVGGIALDIYGPPGSGATLDFIKQGFLGSLAGSPTITFTNDMLLGNSDRTKPLTYLSHVNPVTCGAYGPKFVMDYDRDGRDDVMSVCSSAYPYVSRSGGNGNFVNDANAAFVLPYPPKGWVSVPPPTFYDVNGDGLQDVVSCTSPSNLELRLRQGLGGFDAPIKIDGLPNMNPGGQVIPELVPYCATLRPTHQSFDVDGDGTPDLVSYFTTSQLQFQTTGQLSGWYVLRYNRDASPMLRWQKLELPKFGNDSEGQGLLLGDFNGDGLTDIWKSATEATLWMNTGGAFAPSSIPLYGVAPASNALLKGSALVDHDGDGRLDVLQHWDTPNDVFGTNLNIKLNSATYEATRSVAGDVSFALEGSGVLAPARFTTSGDVDGDGNLDLFGNYRVHYGSGLHKMLLAKVTDGLGNVIHVNYDAPDTYHASCSTTPGSQWPESCVKRLRGLVSSHTEGFADTSVQGGTHVGERVERSYQYTYENARVSATGHGWLGFEKRTVAETVNNLNAELTDRLTSVTTKFLPPFRYRPSGGAMAANEVDPPYLYPLAGMQDVTITDQTKPNSVGHSSIEDIGHSRRTVVSQNWDVKASADGRPFPELLWTITQSYSRDLPEFGDAMPFEENGDLRITCTDENFLFDGYGNVVQNSKSCGQGEEIFERLDTTTDFDPPNTANWFIANPNRIATTSTRGGGRLAPDQQPPPLSQTQVVAPHFDPATGLLASVTRDPEGDNHKIAYTRDANGFGNIVHIDETAAGEVTRTTDIAYDDDNVFPISTTNAKGHETQVAFDTHFGTVAAVVDPNGIPSQTQFDGFGRVASSITPEGTTTYILNALPFTPASTAAGATYPRLQVTAETLGTQGSFAGRTTERLDYRGRVVQSKHLGLHGDEVVTERVFDSSGHVAGATSPHLADEDESLVPYVIYTYDFLDRVLTAAHSDGATSQIEYASAVALSEAHGAWIAGLPCNHSDSRCPIDVEIHTDTRFANELPKRSVAVRDYKGLIVRTIDGDNLDVAIPSTNDYSYGPFGRLVQLRDNGSTTTTFAYYPFGQLKKHKDPDSGDTDYTYNAFGELKTSTDPKQQRRTHSYDTLGRLQQVIDALGVTINGTTTWTTTGTSTWTYDEGASALGRLSRSMSATNQEVQYGYEASTATEHRGLPNSVTYVINGSVYSITNHYDDLGRISKIDYPVVGAGAPIFANYKYDGASGVLNEVTEGPTNSERAIWKLDSTSHGFLPTQETFGNGAVSSFEYDGDRRWLTSINTKIAGNTVQNLGYDYYGNGQVAERFTAFDSQSYAYDVMGRLSAVQGFGSGGPSPARYFPYDNHGNLAVNEGVGITFYDPLKPHIPTTVGSSTYTPDANGNLAARTGPEVPGGSQTFSYTPFDLPLQIVTGSRTTQFAYSADEFRVARHDPDVTRHYASDLYQRVITNSTGATAEEHFRISGFAEIIRKPGSEQTLYFHPDHLGTPETISDGAGGVTHQNHSPFGQPQATPPSLNGFSSQVGFTGQIEDNDLGLIDMGGRVYDPLAGRFTTADPIMQAPFGLSQGQNRYAYVGNDPINRTDPSGFAFSTKGDLFAQGHLIGDSMTVGGAAFVGGALLYGIGSAIADSFSGTSSPVDGGGGGLARAGVSVGAHVVINLLVNPSVPPSDYSYSAPAPTAAPTSSPSGSMKATAQSHGGLSPLVQERATVVEQRAGVPPLVDAIMGPPPVTRGAIRPDEPFADPYVRHAMGRLWTDSQPWSMARKEQGAWGHRIPGTNEYWLERVRSGGNGVDAARELDFGRDPVAGDDAFAVHTHPNSSIHPPGTWVQSADGADWAAFVQHTLHAPGFTDYIVSKEGIFRLNGGTQEWIAPIGSLYK